MRFIHMILATFAIILAASSLPVQAGDGCQYPFVWREAFRGDHVCVTPDIRTQAARDNAAAIERINPGNHDYGPDTCRYGYVWREARPSDHVCVVPETRTQAVRDNAATWDRYATDSNGASSPNPPVSGDASGASPPSSEGNAACCPSSMLVCPLGRSWCR